MSLLKTNKKTLQISFIYFFLILCSTLVLLIIYINKSKAEIDVPLFSLINLWNKLGLHIVSINYVIVSLTVYPLCKYFNHNLQQAKMHKLNQHP